MFSRHGILSKTQEVCTEFSACSFALWNAITAEIHYETQIEDGGYDLYKVSEGADCEPICHCTSRKACCNMQRDMRLCDTPVQRQLHEGTPIIGNSIINVHARGTEALQPHAMSNESLKLDGVTWNALIAAYVEDENIDKAMACIHQMQCHGLSPNANTFICILKLCASMGATDQGQLVHAQLDKNGLLEKDIVVGTVLIDMYCRCGSLAKAREVFHELPAQDTVSWNVLIAGHIQHGLCKEAIEFFEEMKDEGLNPNSITFASILKSCGIIGAVIKGHSVHTQIVTENLTRKSVLVSNALIDMYGKCGLLESAQKVFQDLATQDVISWNTLITAYTHQKQCDEAKRCFERMQCEGLLPSTVSYACILKACGNLGALSKGVQIHAQNDQQVFLEKGKILANALLDMYVKCGALAKAQVVFSKLRARDVVSWTLIVGGYAQEGHGEVAVTCFERMQCESFCPNLFTFVAVLRAYGSTRASEKVQSVHSQMSGDVLFENDTTASNALMDAYMKCGLVAIAQEMFKKLLVKDSVSWNVLISGYAQLGRDEEALSCYESMKYAGFSPDAFTYACICKACGSLCAVYEAQQIHAKIVSAGFLETDIIGANSLVDMLTKCGMLEEAQEVFDRLSVRDIVSWNSLIAGYAQHERSDEALRCFEQMRASSLTPDVFTFASVVRSCGSLGASCKGQEIHADVARDGPSEIDIVLGTALIGMYATFGMLAEAQEVFDELPVRDMASYNALLAGYSQSGEDDLVIKLLEKLMEEEIGLDSVTSSIVLDACIHAGLLDEGQMYFEIMSTTLGTFLTVEHYNCLIDLWGRVGHLEKAVLVIKEMPFSANFAVWLTLLGACQNCRHVMFGRWAFEHAAELGEKDAAAHVLMSNIYAGVAMHEMTELGLWI